MSLLVNVLDKTEHGGNLGVRGIRITLGGRKNRVVWKRAADKEMN
jgi:hypothetical protein